MHGAAPIRSYPKDINHDDSTLNAGQNPRMPAAQARLRYAELFRPLDTNEIYFIAPGGDVHEALNPV